MNKILRNALYSGLVGTVMTCSGYIEKSELPECAWIEISPFAVQKEEYKGKNSILMIYEKEPAIKIRSAEKNTINYGLRLDDLLDQKMAEDLRQKIDTVIGESKRVRILADTASTHSAYAIDISGEKTYFNQCKEK